MTEVPDEELVRAAQRGSTEAVATLFERHWRDAWRLAATVTGSPHDADDAAQQAFVRAIARIRRLRDPRRFRPWLHRIVLNETRDERRRRRRETLVDPPADRAFEHHADEPGPAVEALAGLDRDRRAVVVLRHCLGYSLEETAALLGVPVGTVQSRAARGLAQLRARLEVADAE
jgi:RNA polymerase sigma-70 factor (ECF subfamily)